MREKVERSFDEAIADRGDEPPGTSVPCFFFFPSEMVMRCHGKDLFGKFLGTESELDFVTWEWPCMQPLQY